MPLLEFRKMSEIPEMPPVTISVPIPGELRDRLQAIARRDLTSLAAVSRLGLLRYADAELPADEHLEETEHVRDLERESGVSSRKVHDRVATVDAERRGANGKPKRKGRRG